MTSPSVEPELRHRVEHALTAFMSRQRARLATIDEAMSPVADALEGLVLGGGKRLRPAFAYRGYLAAGGKDNDEVITTVAALELLHASALIHDDLMDASDTRRGAPAVHRRFAQLHGAGGWAGDGAAFGAAAAILLGDLCLSWSDEMYHGSGVDPAALLRAQPVYDEMRTEVMAGQYLDVLSQATGDTSVERASKVARYKSAKYTVERPLLLGAALADAAPAVATALAAFGLPLGEAFQLRDDVLGVFGDPALTGKPAGDDLREGKRTYLVATAHALADDAQRAVLRDNLGDRDLGPDGVTELRKIITQAGALAATEERIDQLTAEALTALDGATIDATAEAALRTLATAATRRHI